MSQGGLLQLQWRPFGFALPQPLVTAAGIVQQRRGWLLRLQSSQGDLGWGEAAPLDGQLEPLAAAFAALDASYGTAELERLLQAGQLPPTLAFALGAALAELAGLPQRRWLPPPPAAQLLPAGSAAIEVLEQLEPELGPAPVFKWKLAVCADGLERELLELLLQRLPVTARLRLDANGGWSRATAAAWAGRLAGEPRLQWLEQPLAPADQAGLEALASQVPVALDESLQCDPDLRSSWPGWQVRRPSQEGDPRVLLAALERGRPRLMLSTAFETGIGRRWLEHLAALQAEGPTPAAPGLAPGWQAPGALASADPAAVWAAAAQISRDQQP
jgi:O-succinylbenzoate synthase